MTPDQFRQAAHRMVEWMASYMERLDRLPVRASLEPGRVLSQLPEHPPRSGPDDLQRILADLDSLILPGLTHWQSPGFFAYFPCNASAPAILGELASAALNVNGMLWETSPAATELEIKMLDWAAEAFALPDAFRSTSPDGGGCIQGTASESTLVALLAARRRAVAQGHRPDSLTAYASAEAHSSFVKAAMIAGMAQHALDRSRVRLIPTDARFAMDADALADAIARDRATGLVPCFVCATVGTTSTLAVDPLDRIGPVAADAGAWLHVDAAHAGVAAVCPEFRWIFRGVEHADSLCTNPHKRLLTNFDCDLFWTRRRSAITDALSVNPAYLACSTDDVPTDFRDWQIPLGRRFRALKLWFVFRHYGLDGLCAHVRRGVELARLFHSRITRDGRFDTVADPWLDLVCFRPTPTGDAQRDDRRCASILRSVNDSGRCLLSATRLPIGTSGRPVSVLRCCIGAPTTTEERVLEAADLLLRAAERADLG